MTAIPPVSILLATYNGATWLDEQLQTIFAQCNVRVRVIASDDSSSDNTRAVLKRWSRDFDLVLLPPSRCRFGRAHRNFLRLVRDADVGDSEYVALSDQDDIWFADKLTRAIRCLGVTEALGYSSNVTAFWPDGRRRLIDKAQPIRSNDHLFGSPGPGCTFVLPRKTFDRLKTFVESNFDRLQSIWVHDWLIYSFVRTNGGEWYIDHHATMLYRQHDQNEIGVNSGWRAAFSRLRRVMSGAYRQDILSIADALGDDSSVVRFVRRLGFKDRLLLVLRVRECRRRLSDCIVLGLFFMIMRRA